MENICKISLFYNSKNAKESGCEDTNPGAYSAGNVIFDLDINEPSKVIARSKHCSSNQRKIMKKLANWPI